jgi:hypothetical protein
MSERRTQLRPPPQERTYPAPGEAWAVHRTAIDVALAFGRSIESAARSKDREGRLRRAAKVAEPEERADFSGT